MKSIDIFLLISIISIVAFLGLLIAVAFAIKDNASWKDIVVWCLLGVFILFLIFFGLFMRGLMNKETITLFDTMTSNEMTPMLSPRA
jgi:uncharacterized membrane protein YjfL (UPF0719 family)